MTSWFLSDIHLKGLEERNGQTLLRFLFYLNQNPKQHQIFLLGDIFDFWLSNGRTFVNYYKPLLNEIKKFKDQGGEVYYFEGNHDFHIDVYWTKVLGISVFEKEEYFKIGNLTVRLEHGDFINSEDVAYLKYREFIRRPYIEFFGHFLPGFFWKAVGERLSHKSRRRTANYAIENKQKVQSLIRSYAHKVYAQKPFDLIITGHMHIRDSYTFDVQGKKITSINLGTWLEKPTALKLQNDQFETVDMETILKEQSLETVSKS